MKRKAMVYNVQAFKRAGEIQRRNVTIAAKKAVQRAAELKGVDILLDAAAVSSNLGDANNMTIANSVGAGSDYYQRVGKKIKMKSLRVLGELLFDIGPISTTLNIEGLSVRMVVVLDKSPTGTIPNFDAIFGTTVAAGTEAGSLYAPVALDRSDRFRILRDRTYTYNPNAGNHNGGTEDLEIGHIHFDEFIKLGFECSYNSTSGAVMNLNVNAIYVCFKATDNSTNIIQASLEKSFARLRYTDV